MNDLPTVKEAQARVREADKQLKAAKAHQMSLPIDRENYDPVANSAASDRIKKADMALRIAKDSLKHAKKRESSFGERYFG